MKKTEIINAAVTPETKAKLQEIAKRKEWTLSYTINRILEDYQEDTKDTLALAIKTLRNYKIKKAMSQRRKQTKLRSCRLRRGTRDEGRGTGFPPIAATRASRL